MVVAIALSPSILNKTYKIHFPIELEILISIMIILDVTLGNLLRFYETFDYFDKFLHYNNSLLITFIGFMIYYAAYFSGRLKISRGISMIIIVLITLGLGGFWEIMEYFFDRFLATPKSIPAQGSPTMSPLDDTMFDLILDFFGGIGGAFFGTIYLKYSKRTNRRRFLEIMSDIQAED